MNDNLAIWRVELYVELLIWQFENRHSAWYTAYRLGTTGDPRAFEPLLRVTQDPDLELQERALTALGTLGDPRAFEPLTAALEHESPKLRGIACAALCKLGDTRAVGPLCKLLESAALADTRNYAWGHVLEALARWEAAAAYPAFLHVLRHGDSRLAATAIRRLGRIDRAGAEWVLPSLLVNANPEARASAAYAVAELPHPGAFELLAVACGDGEPRVRAAAIRSLGTLRDLRARELMDNACHDGAAAVRLAAAAAIVRLEGTIGLPLLREFLADADAEIRREAVSALRAALARQPVAERDYAPLLRVVKNPRELELIRGQAALSLSALQCPAIRDLLVDLLDEVFHEPVSKFGLDGLPLVRWIVPALQYFGGPAVVEPLERCLCHGLKSAAAALTALANPAAARLLRGALEWSLPAETLLEVINGVVVYHDARSVPALGKLLSHKVEYVAASAAVALGALGQQRALGALRSRLRPLLGERRPVVLKAVRLAVEALESSRVMALPVPVQGPPPLDLPLPVGKVGADGLNLPRPSSPGPEGEG